MPTIHFLNADTLDADIKAAKLKPAEIAQVRRLRAKFAGMQRADARLRVTLGGKTLVIELPGSPAAPRGLHSMPHDAYR